MPETDMPPDMLKIEVPPRAFAPFHRGAMLSSIFSILAER